MNTTRAAGQHTLRERNLATVVDAIFSSRLPPSRAAVAAHTGLTKATVSTLVDRLVAARIVQELPLPTDRGVGRPGVPLAPAPRSLVGLGLEVSAGYFGGRIIDLAGNVIAERIVAAELRGLAPARVLADLGALARDLIEEVEAESMVVTGARLALPGLVRAESGHLEVAPNLGWQDLDASPLLGLGDLPVRSRNEAKLAGLAQTPLPVAVRRDGDEDLPHSFLYVSGGVGIGSAILLERELYVGRHGFSGEIGHIIVHPDGPECRCGNRGCLEQYAGESAILEAAGLGSKGVSDHGEKMAEMMTELAAGGERSGTIREAIAVAADALGRALADSINMIDVEAVVLGGSYATLFEEMAGAVRERLLRGVLFAAHEPLEVLVAPARDYAALTGGGREVLRGVLAAPAEWVRRARR